MRTRRAGNQTWAAVNAYVHEIERGDALASSDVYQLMPFALLRLPTVVLVTIFQLITPLAIIDFSLCSKRSRFLVKLFGRRIAQGYSLSTRFDIEECCVVFETDLDAPFHRIYIRRPDQKVKTTRSLYSVIVVNDPITSLQNLTEYIYDLFRLKYKAVQLNLQHPERKRALVMEKWTYDMRSSLQHVCLLGSERHQATKREERDLLKFLNNYNDCEMMCVHVKATSPITDIIHMRYLHSHHSQWATVDTLWNFKSPVLVFMESNLTNNDISCFLKDWQGGRRENNELKDMIVELKWNEILDVEEIVKGLDAEELEESVDILPHGSVGPDHNAHMVTFADGEKFALVFKKEYFGKLCLVVRFERLP